MADCFETEHNLLNISILLRIPPPPHLFSLFRFDGWKLSCKFFSFDQFFLPSEICSIFFSLFIEIEIAAQKEANINKNVKKSLDVHVLQGHHYHIYSRGEHLLYVGALGVQTVLARTKWAKIAGIKV